MWRAVPSASRLSSAWNLGVMAGEKPWQRGLLMGGVFLQVAQRDRGGGGGGAASCGLQRMGVRRYGGAKTRGYGSRMSVAPWSGFVMVRIVAPGKAAKCKQHLSCQRWLALGCMRPRLALGKTLAGRRSGSKPRAEVLAPRVLEAAGPLSRALGYVKGYLGA